MGPQMVHFSCDKGFGLESQTQEPLPEGMPPHPLTMPPGLDRSRHLPVKDLERSLPTFLAVRLWPHFLLNERGQDVWRTRKAKYLAQCFIMPSRCALEGYHYEFRRKEDRKPNGEKKWPENHPFGKHLKHLLGTPGLQT